MTFSKRHLRTVVALLGTVLALGWVWSQVDPTERAEALRQGDPRWLAFAVLLVPVQTLLAAERWLQVSRALGLPLTRREAWTEFGLSTAINQILPGGIGGDAFRIWRQRSSGLARATRSAIADRWWGQTTLLLFVVLGVLFWPDAMSQPDGLGGSAAFACVVVAGVWFVPTPIPAIGPLAADLRRSAHRAPAICILLSISLLLAILAGFAACGQAVGHESSRWVWSVAPLALLAASLPISAGGWGLREGSLVLLLPYLGWSEAQALSVSVWFGLTFAMGTLPGLLVLTLRRPDTESTV